MKLIQLLPITVVTGCATSPPIIQPKSVTVITGGDDGLTQRLADAIGGEVANSHRLVMAPSGQSATLTIRIPSHVDWQEVEGRTLARYRVEFQREGTTVSSASGTCWDDELLRCAKQIVAAATQTPR